MATRTFYNVDTGELPQSLRVNSVRYKDDKVTIELVCDSPELYEILLTHPSNTTVLPSYMTARAWTSGDPND